MGSRTVGGWGIGEWRTRGPEEDGLQTPIIPGHLPRWLMLKGVGIPQNMEGQRLHIPEIHGEDR